MRMILKLLMWLAIVVIVIVAMVYGVDALRTSYLGMLLGMSPSVTQSTPQVVNKGLMVDALKKEPKIMVVEQDYTITFILPNAVRQRMLDMAQNDKTFLDKVSLAKSKLDNFFIGDSIEMTAKGRVVLVVDTKSISTEDVVQDENTITITVPPVRVYDVIVDQDVSVPIERDRGVWLKLMDIDELRNQAQASIRQQIMNQACAQDIMAQGQSAAPDAVSSLIQAVVPDKTIVVNVGTAPCALPK